ncbi:MAG: hypothetical protein IPF68_14425 [Bacteroidales bacterium]|nr:hypothetical protein [Bacteroidales bacterium]
MVNEAKVGELMTVVKRITGLLSGIVALKIRPEAKKTVSLCWLQKMQFIEDGFAYFANQIFPVIDSLKRNVCRYDDSLRKTVAISQEN